MSSHLKSNQLKDRRGWRYARHIRLSKKDRRLAQMQKWGKGYA
jgi:hypothetical protein